MEQEQHFLTVSFVIPVAVLMSQYMGIRGCGCLNLARISHIFFFCIHEKGTEFGISYICDNKFEDITEDVYVAFYGNKPVIHGVRAKEKISSYMASCS